MTGLVVIARWERDVQTVLDLIPEGWRAVVIQQGGDRPNEGREPGAFAWAIQHRRLEEKVAFLQDAPEDHCPEWAEMIQKPLLPSGFRWLPEGNHTSEADGAPHDSGVPVRELYENLTGLPWPGSVSFAAGGQFVCDLGLLVCRHDWKRIEELAGVGRNAWALERLWQSILVRPVN